MAPDEFKNLGFADEKHSERQAESEGATVPANQDKEKEVA